MKPTRFPIRRRAAVWALSVLALTIPLSVAIEGLADGVYPDQLPVLVNARVSFSLAGLLLASVCGGVATVRSGVTLWANGDMTFHGLLFSRRVARTDVVTVGGTRQSLGPEVWEGLVVQVLERGNLVRIERPMVEAGPVMARWQTNTREAKLAEEGS